MLVSHIWNEKIQLYFLRVGFSFVFGILRIVNIMMCSLSISLPLMSELREDTGKKTPEYYLLTTHYTIMGRVGP